MKSCSTCSTLKPLTDFWRNKNKPDGLDNLCRDCRRNSSKKYRSNHKTNIKQYERAFRNTVEFKLNKRVKKYRLEVSAFQQMVSDQFGKCKICGKQEDLVIDHCHLTGKVRGLICNLCNWGLGCFKDSPTVLLNAASYLSREEVK